LLEESGKIGSMISIPKKVEYSVMVVAYLAKKQGEVVALSEVARRTLLPHKFIGQMATLLKQGGILDSKEGNSGGYFLAKGWEGKNLYNLFEILGEDKKLVTCLGDDKSCSMLKTCGLRKFWEKIDNVQKKEFRRIKLKEIALAD
jgi:Rrf2 family nitric oxide-sensitive transcriptional repressor